MSQQTTVGPPSSTLRLGVDGEDRQEERDETTHFLYSYVFSRSTADSTLSADQVEVFQHANREVGGGDGAAIEVGRRLAQLGDEIDAAYQEEIQEVVEMTGSPESAFRIFNDVVKNVFEWDENTGAATINLGRIAALLAYCYRLCRTYIDTYFGSKSLLTFMAMIAGWLFKVFLRARVYEWLEKQGGWGQLLSAVAGGWSVNAFLVIGLASLAIWAIAWFRGR